MAGRTIKVAAFTLMDGGKKIAEFDGYDDLYEWASKNRKKYPTLLGTILGDPYIIMMINECPLKYDRKTGKLYELSWHEVQRGGKGDSNRKSESPSP